MATVTANVTKLRGAQQFRGVLSDITVVTFTVGAHTISGNSNEETIVPAEGVDHEADFVLGWTHTHVGAHSHEITETFHTWDEELHLVAHNRSGSPVDLPATTYRVIVGRLVY